MLAEQTQAQDVGLRTRGLDIQERALQRNQAQDDIKRYDGIIADVMTQAGAIIKEGRAVGMDPAKLLATAQSVIDTAKPLAAKIGRDPAALDAQIRAQLAGPRGFETATAAGTASAAKTVAEAKGLEAAGFEGGIIKDPVKKIEAENKLRDDYLKESKAFVTVRDYRGNMQSLPEDVKKWSGADDIVAVFAFMKMQDPNSAVMPGEQANAANAGGVPEAVRGLYNKLLGGGSLGEGALGIAP